jgi:hypothetical protein
MSFEKLVSLISRLFFLGAFVSLSLALIERIANGFGYTILQHRGGRLLEFAVVLLVFVIAAQLREMKEALRRAKL